LDGSDLAYRWLKKSQEEEKEGNKRKQKIEDRSNDEKSDISTLTTKTTKTRGKHLDKYCPACCKTIKGSNWSKHIKNVHDREAFEFERRPKMSPNYGKGKFIG